MESFETTPIKTPEQIHTDELLKKVNATLESIGLAARYKKIAESIEGCETLKGKKVLMVDDLANLLKSFIADLMVATDGNASVILHSDQSEDTLLQQILEMRPEIILMDKNLANGTSGVNIVRKIALQHPEITCIGFSSESSAGNEFVSAGAKGFVDKDTADTAGTIQAIANVISN